MFLQPTGCEKATLEGSVSTLRLKLFGGGAIALALAVVVAACGGGSTSSTSTEASTIKYKPGVRLVCIERPCGSDPSNNTWRGYYIALENDFPVEAPVLITATYPDGKPYPAGQYTPPGKLFGLEGNVQYTDENGELPEFKWSAYNVGGKVDPPGVYHLTFRFQYHGEVIAVNKPLKMVKLP